MIESLFEEKSSVKSPKKKLKNSFFLKKMKVLESKYENVETFENQDLNDFSTQIMNYLKNNLFSEGSVAYSNLITNIYTNDSEINFNLLFLNLVNSFDMTVTPNQFESLLSAYNNLTELFKNIDSKVQNKFYSFLISAVLKSKYKLYAS